MKDDQTKTDNSQFAEMNNINDLKTISFIVTNNIPYPIVDNIFQQPEKERNNFQGQK